MDLYLVVNVIYQNVKLDFTSNYLTVCSVMLLES
jgi:hypothetical protein